MRARKDEVMPVEAFHQPVTFASQDAIALTCTRKAYLKGSTRLANFSSSPSRKVVFRDKVAAFSSSRAVRACDEVRRQKFVS